MADRNVSLDIAKGIGILLVVLGHNWSVLREEGEVYRIIFSFHIPLFLFISGIFLKDNDPPGDFARSRADALLKPFLVIVLFVSILRSFGFTDYSSNTASGFILFFQMLYSTRGYISLEWLPLWYIPHLFLALILSKIVLQITNGFNHRTIWLWGGAGFFLTAGIWFVNTALLTNPRPPFTSDVLLISSAIILTGFLLRDSVHSMIFHLPLFLASIIVFFLLHYFFNDTIDLGSRMYSNPVISTLQAVLGIYSILSISLAFKQVELLRNPLVYMGTASLFIMMFHNLAQVHVYWTFIKWGYGDLLSNAISFVAGVTFPLILWELIKRQKFLSAILLPKRPAER